MEPLLNNIRRLWANKIMDMKPIVIGVLLNISTRNEDVSEMCGIINCIDIRPTKPALLGIAKILRSVLETRRRSTGITMIISK